MAKEFLSAEAKAVIEKAICDTVATLEKFEVVEIKYFTENGNPNLSVLIWSADGVDLNACELVHNTISTALDRYEELFPENYVLNVSSQGLDRPVVTDDDFRRALGTDLEIVTKDGKLHGTLTAYDAENITILTGGKTPKNVTINRNSTVKVQPYIRF